MSAAEKMTMLVDKIVAENLPTMLAYQTAMENCLRLSLTLAYTEGFQACRELYEGRKE